MNILLVYPSYPDTFWGFKHALKFVSKKAAFPPLGLITVAAMLPKEWKLKLIDMNISRLTDEDIRWADYVFISAMSVQQNSARHVIKKCNELHTKIIAGGPLFTTDYEEFTGVDHFVLNEAEVTLPLFLKDLENGHAGKLYTSEEKPEITNTVIPAWHLLDMKKYSSMSIQYSRGCPYDCEFCDITVLNGRIPRTKTAKQVINELNTLYKYGWRKDVFIVDDNFIGNKNKLKKEILPALTRWMEACKHPFQLYTEVSINLADDDELLQMMVDANFKTVFVGIETPNEESLIECNKFLNRKRNMVDSVKKLQNCGLQVQGGFIVGFDNDPKNIFDKQIEFIQKSGIVTAMVGLLNAPTGTRLYKRLKKENRLLSTCSGNNTDCSINFIPKMKMKDLLSGYQRIIQTIYYYKNYYERVKTFLTEYKPRKKKLSMSLPHFEEVKAFLKSVWHIGIKEKGRRDYWDFLGWTLLRYPRYMSTAVGLSIYGFHSRKIVENYDRLINQSNPETV